MTEQELEKLFPQALAWVQTQEILIFQRGAALSDQQMEDARRVGLRRPEKVRVLISDTVPFPFDPVMQQAAVEMGILGNTAKGATFGYGIWLHSDYADNRYLLVCQLALLARQEKLGNLERFLKIYLKECIEEGDGHCRMEREAYEHAERICFE